VFIRIIVLWCLISVFLAPALGALLSGLADPADDRVVVRHRNRSVA
jgi:hypothetical protein